MPDGPGRYLDLAEECRELAESSLSDDVRRRWLTLADTWLSIHDQVIALAHLEKRDAQLSGEPGPQSGDKDDSESWH